MKCILSVNNKFMDFSPTQLVNIIKRNSINCDGVEISINFGNNDEINYLKNLAFECQKNNLHFQVHGNSLLSLDDQLKYFEMLYPISDMLGYKINVVLHSITGENNNDSINITTNYLNTLANKIDKNRTIISLENLNDVLDNDRLDLKQITPIVMNNENIYCTYDIGHVIADYGTITDIIDEMIPLITNVHIHTHNSNYSGGYDHKPIYKNDEYWDEIIKGITFLKLKKYEGPVVFEYDLYACPGETKLDKIISYLNSIDYVALRIK